jgi:putative transposase
MPRASQLALPLRERNTWGGRRRGAGRKPNNSARPLVSRKSRPKLRGSDAIHVTLRVRPEIPSLRVLNGWVRAALLAGAEKPDFRVIHFSIQGNHIHLITEATHQLALSRGIQGITIRIARAVNQAISRKRGKVFSDRYHEHVLRSLRETHAAIAYVLENYRKHCAESGRAVSPAFIDPHSSAIYLAGHEPNPLPTPQFWKAQRALLEAPLHRLRPRPQ